MLFGRYNGDWADIVDPTDSGLHHEPPAPVEYHVAAPAHLQPHGGERAEVRVQRIASKQRARRAERGADYGPRFVALTGPQDIVENGTSCSVLDDLAIVRGRHNLKVGGEIRRIFVGVGEGNTTSLSYSSRPNLQINRLESFGIVDFPLVEGQRWWYFGYSQDDLKLRSNLTVNAGLRYEYYSVVVEKEGRDKVWRMACGGFCPPGTSWYDPDRNNFAPRLGVAWLPGRFNNRTVIRAGYGIFYGPGQNDDVFAPIDNAGSRIGLERAQVATLAYPIDPFLALAASTGAAPRAVDETRVDSMRRSTACRSSRRCHGASSRRSATSATRGTTCWTARMST